MANRLEPLGHRRMGLGLAAIGRPGYITVNRGTDLPADRAEESLRRRTHELLDEAYRAGVRYFDVARSYGLAEAFLADWLASRGGDDVVVGSKWGYRYTAQWRVDAPTHEVKEHSLEAFDRQLAETRHLLDGRLDLYQVHSVTPESPALTDTALHRRLAELAATGVTIGFSVSGPKQAEAIRAALAIRVDGARLFDSVQATWNLLETSATAALADASAEGVAVIVKECLANGRLADRRIAPQPLLETADRLGVTPDAIALAAVLRQPWVTIALSGASTVSQLSANLAARRLAIEPATVEHLLGMAEPAADYWKYRAALPWT